MYEFILTANHSNLAGYVFARYIVFENSHYLRNFPGPGAYESKPVLNNNGVYFVSKFKNSGACTINPSKSARFANYRGTIFIDFLLKWF